MEQWKAWNTWKERKVEPRHPIIQQKDIRSQCNFLTLQQIHVWTRLGDPLQLNQVMLYCLHFILLGNFSYRKVWSRHDSALAVTTLITSTNKHLSTVNIEKSIDWLEDIGNCVINRGSASRRRTCSEAEHVLIFTRFVIYRKQFRVIHKFTNCSKTRQHTVDVFVSGACWDRLSCSTWWSSTTTAFLFGRSGNWFTSTSSTTWLWKKQLLINNCNL